MAATRVRPGTTATPPGMEGVRPGSSRPPRAPRPPRPLRRPGGPPMVVSFNPDGTTTLKPPAAPPAAAAAAPPPPPVAPAAPTTPFNYADAFLADPRYATGLAGITQSQLGIGSKYGLRINRDTDKGSPTYGMVMYRKPKIGADGKAVVDEQTGKPVYESTGITGKINPQTGAMTYSDAAGKTYGVADLELDVVPVARGEAGYLEGALGQAAASSEKQQFGIGDAAARAGAGRSGMRAASAVAETQALQNALRGLNVGAAGELAGTTNRYADLLNSIFPDLVKKAGEYETPPVETPAAPEAPAPAATPTAEYSGYNTPGAPTSGPLSPGPGGGFMTVVGNVTLERNTNDAAIRAGLRALLKNPAYQLTPQQIRYINSLITGRYKGNKKY